MTNSDVITTVNDKDFDTLVLQNSLPVIVDFWAEWCGPCRQMAPVLQEAAKEYQGKVQFAAVDVDKNNDSSVRFSVRAIPTLLLFNQGKQVGQHVGVLSKARLAEFLKDFI